ncbi:hypothetical protein Sste5346_000162 [Sporothrix stenoceras]|uniref:NADAR domain-containing protein n=1 Tax=Sporothrix stenoceras TaxID=5173 RepID=A0ABR3ZSS9_9PEZI
MPPKHQRKTSGGGPGPQKDEQDPIFFHKEWKDFGFMYNYAPARFSRPDPAVVCASWLLASPPTTSLDADTSDNVPIIEFQGDWLGRDARLEILTDHGRKLLATGDRLLVEAAGRDSFWGIGYGIKQGPIRYQKNWGQNQLGKSLVATRERLRKLLGDSA